jgi:hypothetical protein
MKRRRNVMRTFRFSKYVPMMVFVLLAVAATAEAQVCIRVDETRDMLSGQDRAAAVLHLSRQFELAGKRVVPDCVTPYTISHIRLGDVITATLSGPEGQREGTAQGLNDLPALYSQLVRSLVTSRQIVDRSNVTEAQASALRVHTDSYFYARLGYGGIFSDHVYGRPAFGFGHRTELDSFAIDVSFLNVQPDAHNAPSSSAAAGSLLKLEALSFAHPRANASPYIGGGFSYGSTSVGDDAYYNRTSNKAHSDWSGSGLQGEVTVGYEIARTTTLRVFIQADATLPFYKLSSQIFSTSGVVTTTSQRYSPSLVFSVGFGRQKNHR